MRNSIRTVAMMALIAVGLIALTGCFARTAHVPHSWEFLHVDVDVLQNGDAMVTEKHGYRFSAEDLVGRSGTKTWRHRFIPLRQTDGIDQASVSVNGKPIRYESKTDQQNIVINWAYRTPEQPGVVAFDLSYRVLGLVKDQDDIDAFRWVGIFPSRRSAIPDASVRVRFPESVSGHLTNKVGLGTPTEVELLDERTLLFTAKEPVAPESYVAAIVDLPDGLLDLGAPSLPVAAPAQPFHWRTGAEWSGRAAMALALLAIAGLLANRRRWRKVEYGRGELLKFPPTHLPAPLLAVAGTRQLGPLAMLAAIVDQCHRKLMTVEWSRSGYRLRSSAVPASDWQAALHNALPGDSLSLKELRRELLVHANEIGEVVGQELTRAGFFSENPQVVMRHSKRRVWAVLWLATMVLFSTSVGLWVALLSPQFAVVAGILAALPVGALFPMRNGYVAPTTFGIDQLRDWSGFGEHIEELRARGEDLPGHWLQYAITFNRVHPAWVSGAGGVPEWFVCADDSGNPEAAYGAFMAAWGLRNVKAPNQDEETEPDGDLLVDDGANQDADPPADDGANQSDPDTESVEPLPRE